MHRIMTFQIIYVAVFGACSQLTLSLLTLFAGWMLMYYKENIYFFLSLLKVDDIIDIRFVDIKGRSFVCAPVL